MTPERYTDRKRHIAQSCTYVILFNPLLEVSNSLLCGLHLPKRISTLMTDLREIQTHLMNPHLSYVPLDFVVDGKSENKHWLFQASVKTVICTPKTSLFTPYNTGIQCLIYNKHRQAANLSLDKSSGSSMPEFKIQSKLPGGISSEIIPPSAPRG